MMQQVFTDIYTEHRWRGSESRSGWASSLEDTEILRFLLPGICQMLGAERVLDAPCGDGYWMPDLPGYVGVDIVPEAVEASRRRHPHREYLVADICRDPLPSADLVIARDFFIHLPLADGMAALENIRRTGARYLLATTHLNGANVDIQTGKSFRADMSAEPFNLGHPMALLHNGVRRKRGRWLGLWPL